MTESSSHDVAYLRVAELTEGFGFGRFSPVEVAAALIERIERFDPAVNAMVHVDLAYALAMADEAERRYAASSPLSAIDGVPITVKDLCRVVGMPFRRGSAAMDWHATPERDTPCVARLREAGAVFLGKTATPDAGCKVVTRSAVHGVTANPHALDRTAGGSSGGAAAALALGFSPLAVRSDGAGSLRIPASYTDVMALKPTFGRVPTLPHGVDMPLSMVGPMARNVANCALMLDVMSWPEPADPFAWPVPFSMPADLDAPDLSSLRIATSPRLERIAPLADPELDALVAEAGPLLSAAGASVATDDAVWPFDPRESFEILWTVAYLDTANGFEPDRHALLDPLILPLAEYDRKRIALTIAAQNFFTRYDLLVGPVTPVPAYELERTYRWVSTTPIGRGAPTLTFGT